MAFLLGLILVLIELRGVPITPYARNSDWELVLGNANYLGMWLGLSLLSLRIKDSYKLGLALMITIAVGTRSVLLAYSVATLVMLWPKIKYRYWLIAVGTGLVAVLVALKPESSVARADIYWETIKAIRLLPSNESVASILSKLSPEVGMHWAHLESDLLLAVVRCGVILSLALFILAYPILINCKHRYELVVVGGIAATQSMPLFAWIIVGCVWPYRSRVARGLFHVALLVWLYWHFSCVLHLSALASICRG